MFIGLFSDPQALDRTKTRPCYARNVELWKQEFNFDPTQEGNLIPVKLEAFESGRSFLIDKNAASQIPGLFGTRGYGLQKGHITQQTFVGAYAGKKAASYARDNGSAAIDWSAVEAELSRIDETEATLRAALIREESRGTFYRSDFPESDDAWAKNIICTLNGDSMEVTTSDLVLS